MVYSPEKLFHSNPSKNMGTSSLSFNMLSLLTTRKPGQTKSSVTFFYPSKGSGTTAALIIWRNRQSQRDTVKSHQICFHGAETTVAENHWEEHKLLFQGIVGSSV